MAVPATMIILPMAFVISRDGGPVFYREERLGRDGMRFSILKLRSMVPDAEAALKRYLAAHPEARAEWDERQKLRDDPRITRIGHFIRKTSLDELPQFWNVLRGEMSLVGPRPMLPEQRPQYTGMAYFRMQPGITGPWQTSLRNKGRFADRAHYDTQYFEDMSFGTDLRLLRRAVKVVFKGTGV